MSSQEVPRKESDLKRQIAQARRKAALVLDEARKEAARLRERAHTEGRQMGRSDCKTIFAKARAEAARKISLARDWAEDFEKNNRDNIETEVDWAMDIVLGVEHEQRKRRKE